MAPNAPSAARAARNPVALGARLGALGFAIFMVLELAVYEKGIGRALWISALAGILIFAVGYWFARVTARADGTAADPS